MNLSKLHLNDIIMEDNLNLNSKSNLQFDQQEFLSSLFREGATTLFTGPEDSNKLNIM